MAGHDGHEWLRWAVGQIEADHARSADTHLIKFTIPGIDDLDIYLKDESTHPSGSLKHRLARSLFLYALCNGWVREGTPIIEASSGSTAISEAYFARLLDLKFIAVVPKETAAAKLAEVRRLGGTCHEADSANLYGEAESLACEMNGHYMDQFTYAERATDWRGNNNIAESIFAQMAHERFPVPSWIVVGAGTGGTSATIGRYVRYRPEGEERSRIAVVDPEGSVFAEAWRTGRRDLTSPSRSRIEGIGRPRVEPSFLPSVIDEMISVPDVASFAAARLLSEKLGRRVGPSTGTNLVGSLACGRQMRVEGEPGSIVSLICDGGERYLDTAYSDGWIEANFPDIVRWDEWLRTDPLGPMPT
ncbi:MAG: PLP-dependent cysteine synthase family protein [Pacificimonas sp.]